jgi:hypothetical protein
MKLLIRLIVGTLLGVGALILLVRPTCACTTVTSTLRADMKSNLRNLVLAEEDFAKTDHSYTASLEELEPFVPTADVEIRVLRASRTGFYAEARHAKTDEWRCVVAIEPFTGDSLRPGEPMCQLVGERLGRRSTQQ